jgi:hypothetical protein
MGIAYIPTIECSRWCKNIFDTNNKRILMRCKYISYKHKWQPFELDPDAIYPSDVASIDTKLVHPNISDDEN